MKQFYSLLRFICLLSIACVVALLSCNEETTKPPPISPPIDTTSHSFFFQTEFIGVGASYLRDIFAISDSDVWAVGKIYLPDSSGNADYNNPYNAAHWDGNHWQAIQVPVVNFTGQIAKGSDITSVFASGSEDVWLFSVVGSYARWDGKLWNSKFLEERNGGIEVIFGFTPNDIYFAGSNGSITHWDGKIFTKMESGLKEPYSIIDLCGSSIGGEKEMYAVAHVKNQIRSALLVYKQSEGRWEIVWSSEYGIGQNQLYFGILYSVYSFDIGNYFLAFSDPFVNNTIFERNLDSGAYAIVRTRKIPKVPLRIRGNSRNDVIVVGDRMMVAHYNGLSWKIYSDLMTTYASPLYGLSVRKNFFYACGTDGTRGIILKGSRNQ